LKPRGYLCFVFHICIFVIFKMIMNQLLQLNITPESLEKLRKFLDVSDMNLPLNLKEYRTGMSLWMKSLGVDISYR